MKDFDSSILFTNHTSPLHFISKYTETHNNQKTFPFKIFLTHIPYYNTFDILFIDYIFNKINKIRNQKKLRSEFYEIENVIRNIMCYEYCDISFYQSVRNMYFKGILYFIDLSETEVIQYDIIRISNIVDVNNSNVNNGSIENVDIENGTFINNNNKYIINTNLFIDNVLNLLLFTSKNISLYSFFINSLLKNINYYLNDVTILFDVIGGIKCVFGVINEEIKNTRVSLFCGDIFLNNKICVDSVLTRIEEKRIVNYGNGINKRERGEEGDNVVDGGVSNKEMDDGSNTPLINNVGSTVNNTLLDNSDYITDVNTPLINSVDGTVNNTLLDNTHATSNTIFYCFDIFLKKFIFYVKKHLSRLEKEDGYLKCMNVISEMALKNITDDEIIDDMKIFSKEILNRE